MGKLAVHGGEPLRESKLYYGRQWIDEEDIKAVVDTLRSDYITCGPKVKEIESELASYTGAAYAVACANGTAALHCACIAADIGPGDEVITTPLTFAASANCVLYCGAKPVFADVELDTYNISPESIRQHITEKTKAIIAVDFTGQAVKHKEIREICDEYKLVFIEDAAHAIGTSYNGQLVGSLADMTCFSFHPVKTITCGEGGAILTNNQEYYEKLNYAHIHGITHDVKEMVDDEKQNPWYYEQIMLGYNYRLTDFQAALLLSQLKRINQFKERRKEICKKYDEAFSGMPEIILQKEIEETDSCKHLYIIQLNDQLLKCSRREFFDAMSAENVQCQIHYIPVYWFPYYQRLGYKKGLCPNAERIYERILSIPLYPAMTDDDVKDVVASVKKVVEYYRN